MKIVFQRPGKPIERLVASVDIILEDPDMEGLKINGLALWEGREGGLYVTMPSKQTVNAGGKKQYWDFVRSVGEDRRVMEAFKATILQAWDAEQGQGSLPEEDSF